jgi:hypothetical protein
MNPVEKQNLTIDSLFRELSIGLVARKLCMDYIATKLIIHGVEIESYADKWVESFVIGPQEFKDEIISTTIKLLSKMHHV